jgi:hypothetical protein
MANESVAQIEQRKQRIDEVMVCRLMALARKRWPDEYGTRPKLTLLQGGNGPRHE